MKGSVKERLISFIEYKHLSKNKFEELCGLSKRYVSNISQSIQPDKIKKISLVFPELNMGWLLTGEGEMLVKENRSKKAGMKMVDLIVDRSMLDNMPAHEPLKPGVVACAMPKSRPASFVEQLLGVRNDKTLDPNRELINAQNEIIKTLREVIETQKASMDVMLAEMERLQRAAMEKGI